MNLEEYIRTVPDYPVTGVNFYDVNSLFAGPIFAQVMDKLLNKTKYSFDTPSHIVGVESRGFVMGSIIAYAMKLPFIMVRKKGAKYPGELLEQSYALEYGEATLTLQTGLLGHTDRCVIVDDLVATGGSVMATKQLIEQTGATVLGASTLIDLAYVRDEQPLDLNTVSIMRVPPHKEYDGPDFP